MVRLIFVWEKSKKLLQDIRVHNSGHVSVSMKPTHLITYESFGYIYILNGDINFIYYSK